MTSGDAGVPGSYNWSDTSQLVADQQPQQPRPRPPPQDPSNVSTMSVTTVYHPPTYCPPPQFAHNQSNPPPHVYRRPSHPGVPIYSNQATPSTPNPPVLGPHQGQENSQRKNVTAPSLPPSSSGMTQPNSAPVQFSGVRPGQNTPISVSQPHPRISSVSSISSPATPIAPPIHLDIVLTPVGEIVTMLAAKLQSLITANDRLKAASKATTDAYVPPPSQSKSDPRLLSFHARNIPSITITAYLTRILKYCPTDPEVFISVLVYFDRIMRIANRHAQPLFGAYYSSYNVLPSGPPLVHSPLPGPTHDDDSFAIDSFNVHRLVITTVAVATKFFSDQFYTNSRYARVGGLPLAELNHLEIQFLILLDFNLMIAPVEIQFYADHLLHFWIVEQQRHADKAFLGIVTSQQHQPSTDIKSPITPMTPAAFFAPQTPSSASAATFAYQQQPFHAPTRASTAPRLSSECMEDVQPSHTPLTPHTPYPPENP